MIVVEDTNEGTALYQILVAETRLPLIPFTPVKDKTFRAIPLSNGYRAGKVWHATSGRGEGKWVRAFEAELEAFGPDAVHDDMVDAAAMAYSHAVPTSTFRVRSLTG